MRRALAVGLILALGGWEPFRTADPDVEAGNRAYADGRYDDALAAYDRAARRGAVDPDGLAFDRGTAELKKAESLSESEKQRLTDRALEDLKQAARARDPHVRGAASFNRGNALMGENHLDDAIEAYKQALRDDPELDDARLNLELALRRRQKQQQQAQNGQGQGPQGPGGGNQPPAPQPPGGQNGSGSQGSQGSQGSGGDPQPPGGQGSQGSNQGSSSPNGGQGSNQPPNGQNGQNGQGDPGGNGSNSRGSNGQGSGSQDAQGQDPQAQNAPNGTPKGTPQRGRTVPRSPKTPVDGKLDDLDNYSRRLQKDQARRRATGRSSDPQHDW